MCFMDAQCAEQMGAAKSSGVDAMAGEKPGTSTVLAMG